MTLAPSSLEGLPQYPSSDLIVACDLDYYDGPITGLVRRGAELFWFSWHDRGLPDDEDSTVTPRVFTLHALPAEAIPVAEAWVQRCQELSDECRLIANPHVWPISARQRAMQRPLSVVMAEMEAHHEVRPPWEDLPATAWFSEAGSSAFAAIQTYTLSHQQAADFERWQREVAQALMNEDQPALDGLFREPPVPGDPLDLYFVRRRGVDAEGACIVRDWQGQPLSADFIMTARHRVQCLDGLIPTLSES